MAQKKQENGVEFSAEEKSILLRAVGDYAKTVATLANKVDSEGYHKQAKEMAQSITMLKDIETKLL